MTPNVCAVPGCDTMIQWSRTFCMSHFINLPEGAKTKLRQAEEIWGKGSPAWTETIVEIAATLEETQPV